MAKRNYSYKLRIQFSSSDSASVWKGLKEITNYKTPSPSTVENQQLADDMNEFYCRFEKTPHTTINTSSKPPHPPHLQFRSANTKCARYSRSRKGKAPCPDCVTPVCLKTCANQLAPIFTQIFNRSLELCEVPSCFKCSTIIPSQRNPKLLDLMTTGLWL